MCVGEVKTQDFSGVRLEVKRRLVESILSKLDIDSSPQEKTAIFRLAALVDLPYAQVFADQTWPRSER